LGLLLLTLLNWTDC